MMATRRIAPGPVGARVADNISHIREGRRLSQPELARRIAEAGRPMTAGVLSKTEQLDRRVDVDDLVAIAIALGVSPNRLLLAGTSGGAMVLRYPGDTEGIPVGTFAAESIDLTPSLRLPLLEAWEWASGERPLPGPQSSDADAQERINAFRRENRPHAPHERYFDKTVLLEHPDLIRQAAGLVRAAWREGVSLGLLRDFIEFAAITAVDGDTEPAQPGGQLAALRPVIAAVVTSSRGVLIGRRMDGTPPWTFIAGEQEPGEKPADTIIREVKEEAGLDVRPGQVIGERDHPSTGRHMIYIAARPAGRRTGVFVGDEAELAEVRWASLAEADQLLPGMFEPVRGYLARTLKG